MTIALIVLAVLVLAIGIPLLVGRFLRKRPCYRCGGVATVDYMALHYCVICREVVMRMFPIVGMGGQFGFPGAPGYLEFPDWKDEEKKEEDSNG